ncbi:YSC84-related protein [Bordetella sp. BOR01]|uniref:lipid-binding SYLF domain-containing protein n=1 Tax=Bordetella sp. BOR01 TaxID=2854779 RepID=UPI001C447F8E|nr:lipid-binding SYLF domain-containing protein [Bordetella sp. BOR01]MBV7486046.1 lipid-binding SYLF domain-containing protein [Bordetella sp. BOR01]
MKDTLVGSIARPALFAVALLFSAAAAWAPRASAASAAEIASESAQALQKLQAQEPKARALAEKATAILVFPKIVKAGMLVGGEGGEGALIKNGRAQAYYNLAAVSFGLQAGIQTFSYALFFMNDQALQYLDRSDGWAVGAAPNVVVVDKGAAASMSSTTLTQDVYAVPFGQEGLMAGIGLEGSKITRMDPK